MQQLMVAKPQKSYKADLQIVGLFWPSEIYLHVYANDEHASVGEYITFTTLRSMIIIGITEDGTCFTRVIHPPMGCTDSEAPREWCSQHGKTFSRLVQPIFS